MNGSKCAASNCGKATAIKITSARIFTTTRTAFTVALSRVPAINRPETQAMMKTAGRFKRPPPWGPAVSARGSSTPSEARNPVA